MLMWPFRRRPAPLPQLPHPLHPVLDELAEAFAASPGPVTALLLHHAAAVLDLDAVVIDPHSADYLISMRVAEADGTRAALLALSPAAVALTRTRTALENDR
ncbi:hypothetical protein [Streptomyces sp. NPDC020983]|uniref:hypothetical protein n=1 Tax=Streptomyces sp. NPDC020983 TaxID=3365106 RepID=UPI0037A4A7C1